MPHVNVTARHCRPKLQSGCRAGGASVNPASIILSCVQYHHCMNTWLCFPCFAQRNVYTTLTNLLSQSQELTPPSMPLPMTALCWSQAGSLILSQSRSCHHPQISATAIQLLLGFSGGSCRAGESVSGGAAIVTVPLGCLKAGAVAFRPPLPAWKLDAIAKLGFGALNKVVYTSGISAAAAQLLALAAELESSVPGNW